MQDREHHVFRNDILECRTISVPEFMIHCVSIINPNNQNILPTFVELCKTMENKKYYKFWISNTEEFLNKVSAEFQSDNFMKRYKWYDEDIIPVGKQSKFAAYNLNRNINYTNEIVVRIFVLSQQERIELFRELNYDNYSGTLIENLK